MKEERATSGLPDHTIRLLSDALQMFPACMPHEIKECRIRMWKYLIECPNNVQKFIRDLAAVVRYAHPPQFTSRGATVGADSWAASRFHLHAFFTVVFAASLESFQPPPVLRETSANCQHTLLEARTLSYPGTDMPPRRDVKWFLKFVPHPQEPGVDNILLDSINGVIINGLALVNPHIRYHFMKYENGFLTFTDVNSAPAAPKPQLPLSQRRSPVRASAGITPTVRAAGGDVDKERWNLATLVDIADKHSPFHIPAATTGSRFSDLINYVKPAGWSRSSEPVQRQEAFCMVSEAIDGLSMSALSNRARATGPRDPMDIVRWKHVFGKFADLYNAIAYIGAEYGFLHNDLHLGNVYFDINQDVLALIDYGRVHIAGLEDDPNINTIVMRTLAKHDSLPTEHARIAARHGGSLYRWFMSRWNPYLKSTRRLPNGKYLMFIFDLITLCANMGVVVNDIMPDVMANISFIKIQPGTHQGATILSMTHSTAHDIFNEYLASIQRLTDASSRALCDGLMFLAVFMAHRYIYNIRAEDLKSYGFYVYFQYTGEQEKAEAFIDYLGDQVGSYPRQDLLFTISPALQKLKGIRVHGGAGTSRKSSKDRTKGTKGMDIATALRKVAANELTATDLPPRKYKSGADTILDNMIAARIDAATMSAPSKKASPKKSPRKAAAKPAAEVTRAATVPAPPSVRIKAGGKKMQPSRKKSPKN